MSVTDGQKAEAAVFNAAFVSKTTLTTKGDLVGRTTTGPQRVPVGANGDVLVADSAQATGVAYSGRLTTAEGDISTLQGDVSTLQGDVSTLQTDVTTLQGDVSTLQSDVSTAQGDITALQTGKANTTLNNIGSTAVNADILPDGDNTRSLGSGSLNWASIRGVFFGIPGSGTGRFGTPTATGASNSGVSNYRSGSVVDGTSGVANFGSGPASGTGSSGDVNVGAGTVVSGVRGILNLLGRFVTFPSLAANPSSPVAGGVYYNSASNVLRFYNGSAWSDVGGASFTSPTVTLLTSGSGTYNKPANAVALKVRIVGGGAGGGGGGGAGFGNGTNGGNTTFGSLTANGGTGGTQTASNASGGSASGGDINISGSNGGPRWSVSGFPAMGGMGGANPLGMPGANGELNGGSGTVGGGWGGGGGGGGASSANPNGGGGGGGGGYCEKWISSPSATYSYAIGAGGAGGAGGANGAVGGSGSGGVVIVEEYY
jgi:outer membrane murein-binding lipoprotein Lpp